MLKLFLFAVFIAQFIAVSAQDTLSICSFNIQFLGHFKNREDAVLAEIVKNHDIVVVQELVAAPNDGKYPDGAAFKKDLESAAFVDEMTKRGFDYWLSTEDTGPTKNHTPTTASEWWIVFYKKTAVLPDTSRCFGFISSPLMNNSVYERVPYAFPFKSLKGKSNFTLISVHLKPGDSALEKQTRQNELKELFKWTSTVAESNKDFYVLGDCNIYSLSEFEHFKSQNIRSLNEACLSTNTLMYGDPTKGNPYDHVFYSSYSKEDILKGSFEVIDLKKAILDNSKKGQYNMEPYVHDDFRTQFSDHTPIVFKIVTGKDSDF